MIAIRNGYSFFFLKESPTTEIYTYLHTLALHDALPIFFAAALFPQFVDTGRPVAMQLGILVASFVAIEFGWQCVYALGGAKLARSDEHTSELQSLMRISYAVFCLNKK